MPIRYLPNDPATGVPSRVVEKSPTRTGGSIGFTLPAAPPEQPYEPGDPSFTHWQARESALRALRVWDDVGPRVGRWQSGSRRLALNPVHGVGLQAFYDRSTLNFNHWPGTTDFFVGDSADAVVHEVGHALLDAVRPDLWNSLYPEIVAFHEAFADCLCLFTGLLDRTQRNSLFATAADPAAVLAGSSPASRIAESVAEAYGNAFSRSDPSATARDANNSLQWNFAHLLPSLVVNGDLSREPHSFSRIFTGCIYDCLRRIYAEGPQTSAGLYEATRVTAGLLIEATRNAPEGVEFFRRVGQAMVLADRSRHGARHQQAIAFAFRDHGITLGSSSLVTPAMPLEGRARSGHSVGLNGAARRDLTRRLGLGDEMRFNYRVVHLGDKSMLEAQCQRKLDLGPFHRSLRNISVRLSDSVLIDNDRKTARVMDVVPLRTVCEESAAAMAAAVLENGLLMADRKLLGSNNALDEHALPAFSIRRQGGTPCITRLRCACHTRPGH